jgi:hypothetical protein
MHTKVYADPLKCRTTKENANVWADILQVTKDKCIERQKETNCGIGLRMATKADRSIMIWAQPGITWRSLETVEVSLQSIRHSRRLQNDRVGCRPVLQT